MNEDRTIEYAEAITQMIEQGGWLTRYRDMPECIVNMAMIAVEEFPRATFTKQCREFAGRGEHAHITSLRNAATRLIQEAELQPDDQDSVRNAADELDKIAATANAVTELRKACAEFRLQTSGATPFDQRALFNLATSE